MLQVRLLGQFDIRADGKPVTIPSRAGQSLFAFLFLNAGTAYRREKLAGLFWPDTSDENARRNLRQELWRIRKALANVQPTNIEYILAQEISISFNANADYWLDVAQLERSSSTDDSSSELISRLALYRGELLPGFYDDWAVLERERLHGVFEQRMQHLMEMLIHEQRWAPVLEWGERWIALGQTPEPAYRALMIAFAALGDKAKVTATFERCQVALDKELGVEPSKETRILLEQLTRGEKIASVDLTSTQVASVHPRVFDEPPAPGEPPFKGLQYFDEADADWFFGREMLTAKLIRHLRARNFLAVIVGASGSGKSSIVRAGVIPSLKKGVPLADGTLPPDASQAWQIHVITPTAHPLEALAISFTRTAESTMATINLIDDLGRDPRALRLYLHKMEETTQRHILLVIDQFEELFTLCHDEFERQAFVDNLLAVLPSGDVTLVITLRADFYPHLAQYEELRDAVAAQQEYIGPMTTEELRQAIEEPARHGNWEFETGLVDLLLRDVGNEPGALPLLSHALLETWKRRSGRTLTFKGYSESGGVHGAIAKTAEAVYAQLNAEEQSIARNIFLRLTELGEGTEDTRRHATFTELIPRNENAESVRAVLNRLADARLATLGEDTAEVAHEALIREWGTLREWLNQDREGLRLHRHLTQAAQEWELLERDPGSLYRGARLAQTVEWSQANPSALNEQERAFLAASAEQEQYEQIARETQRQRELETAQKLAEEQEHRAEEQSRAARQLRQRARFLAGAFMLVVVMAGIALFFGDQARANATESQTNARVATARELAAAALSNLNVDPERSILLALQAVATTYDMDKRVEPQAEDALHRAIISSRAILTLSGGHSLSLSAAEYSPDGTRIATGGQDGRAIIWDIATGKELLTLQYTGSGDAVNGLAYSPDGTSVATANDDGTVKIWNAITGQAVMTLTGHTVYVTFVAYSPDGTRIAASSGDGTVIMWDVATGKELLKIPINSESSGVAFSPDGKRIAVSSDDNVISIRDVASGKELVKLSGHTDVVEKITFSPDGTRAASASRDGTARVWDAASGAQQLLLNLSGQGLGVAFSPSGKWLATSGYDGTARVWDVTSGIELITLYGHASAVYDVSFSPNGTRLVTAGRDTTAKVWDLTSSHELLTFTATDPGGAYSAVAYSPDGKRLATAGNGNTAQVWDAGTGKQLFILSGHTANVNSVLFSPDGSKLATTSDDMTAKLWDAVTGKELLTLEGHKALVKRAAFNADGTRLATVSHDSTAKVWDTVTGKELLILIGQTGPLEAIAFSPDGKWLATTSRDHTIVVWDSSSRKQLLTITVPQVVSSAVAFSPDGHKLLLGFVDGSFRAFEIVPEASQATELFHMAGQTGFIEAVTFSPDGKRFATASDDNTVKIWDAATGQEILMLSGSSGGVHGVAFNPDGTRLATLGGDGLVRIYVLKIEDLVALAESRLTRGWTLGECQKYLHTQVCPP